MSGFASGDMKTSGIMKLNGMVWWWMKNMNMFLRHFSLHWTSFFDVMPWFSNFQLVLRSRYFVNVCFQLCGGWRGSRNFLSRIAIIVLLISQLSFQVGTPNLNSRSFIFAHEFGRDVGQYLSVLELQGYSLRPYRPENILTIHVVL